MKTVLSTVIALCLAVALQAQETQVKEKSKTKVDDGKKVTLTGCLQASPEGGYELTKFTPAGGIETGVALLRLRTPETSTVDLANHVGHRVELTGFVPKNGHDVDVKTRTKTKVESKDQPDMKEKSKSKVEVEPEGGGNFLIVTSVRHIAAICQ